MQGLRIGLAAGLLTWASAGAWAAGNFVYIAETTAGAVRKEGSVTAAAVRWQCKNNACTAEGPWPNPGIAACRALAKQVGHIAYYGHTSREVFLRSGELAQCNEGLAPPPAGTAAISGTLQAPADTLAKPSPGSVAISGTLQAPADSVARPLPVPVPDAVILAPDLLSPLTPAVLTRRDFDTLATALRRQGVRRYDYAEFTSRSEGKAVQLRLDATETISGLVLRREPSSMRHVHAGLFDDRLGNLVYVDLLRDPTGLPIPYSLTATPWGESILSVDRDQDGVVDLAVGNTDGRDFWMLSLGDRKGLLECFEAAALNAGADGMFQAASLCASCVDYEMGSTRLTAGASRCMNERRPRSGTAALGGVLHGSAMQGLLGAPQCSPTAPGFGITAAKLPLSPEKWSDWQIDELVDDDIPDWQANARDDAAAAREVAADTIGTDPEVSEATADLAAALERYAAELDDIIGTHGPARARQVLEARMAGRVVESAWERLYDTLAGEAPAVAARPPASQPAIGPDGMPGGGMEDPRCAGNATATSQGSVWGNFCRNEAGEHVGMMECARRMADSTYAVSGGRCWTETGPADGPQVVCRESHPGEAGGAGPGDGTSEGGSGAGTTDDPRTSNLGGPGIGTRYVDTTPLGGILTVLCSHGECPDFPPVD